MQTGGHGGGDRDGFCGLRLGGQAAGADADRVLLGSRNLHGDAADCLHRCVDDPRRLRPGPRLAAYRCLLHPGGYLFREDPGGVRSSQHLAGCGHDLLAKPLPAADRRVLHPSRDMHDDDTGCVQRHMERVQRLRSEPVPAADSVSHPGTSRRPRKRDLEDVSEIDIDSAEVARFPVNQLAVNVLGGPGSAARPSISRGLPDVATLPPANLRDVATVRVISLPPGRRSWQLPAQLRRTLIRLATPV